MASKGSRTAAYKNTALCTRNIPLCSSAVFGEVYVVMNLVSNDLQIVRIKQVQQEETVLF